MSTVDTQIPSENNSPHLKAGRKAELTSFQLEDPIETNSKRSMNYVFTFCREHSANLFGPKTITLLKNPTA